MPRSRAIHGLILAAFSAAAGPAMAITGNWVEDFAHPYVGLVVFYDATGEFHHRCTGSLLSPTKFLTAGHCTVSTDGVATARVYFQQDAGANLDFTTGVDPITGYPESCAAGTLGTLCATSSELYNYGFDNFAGFPNTRDVGIVILDQPIKMPRYGQLPAAGVLNGIGTSRGTQNTVFTVSGYGLSLRTQAQSAIPNQSFRERLMAKSSLTNINSAQNGGYNIQTQGNGSDRGGTCSGDSGGPVYLGDSKSHLIVAVTSFGLNALCRGTDFGYRLDRAEVLDWINSR